MLLGVSATTREHQQKLSTAAELKAETHVLGHLHRALVEISQRRHLQVALADRRTAALKEHAASALARQRVFHGRSGGNSVNQGGVFNEVVGQTEDQAAVHSKVVGVVLKSCTWDQAHLCAVPPYLLRLAVGCLFCLCALRKEQCCQRPKPF